MCLVENQSIRLYRKRYLGVEHLPSVRPWPGDFSFGTVIDFLLLRISRKNWSL